MAVVRPLRAEDERASKGKGYSMRGMAPLGEMADRVGRMVGARPVDWRPVAGRTRAERWVVRCEDGSSAFVKAAADAATARWLRDEYRVYAGLTGAFMPALLGWEDGDLPVLVVEDLSGAHWPPPWSAERVEAVLAALAAVRPSTPPPGLPRLEDERAHLASWHRVAGDPRPFLSLDLCTPAWLEAALPSLMAAEAGAVLDVPDLLNLDVRSDYLIFR